GVSLVVPDGYVALPGFTPGPRLPDGRPTWRNPSALPRAFVVHRARAATTPEEAHAAVTDPAFRPGEEAVVEAPLPALAPPAGQERAGLLAALNRVPIGERAVRVDGERLYAASPDRWLAALAWKTGLLEGAERRMIAREVKPGMVAVDVGANLGVHTLALARAVGPAGR